MKLRVLLATSGSWDVRGDGVHLGRVDFRGEQIRAKYQWTAHDPRGARLSVADGNGWATSRKRAAEALAAYHERTKGREA